MQVSYWVDKKNTIIKTSTEWDAFALENDGSSFLSDAVLGKPLSSFVTGDITRLWVDTVIKYCRLNRLAIRRPYRCDSPNEKRFMEMVLTPEEEDVVRVDHTIVRTEKYERPVHFTFTKRFLANSIMRCSICNKVRIDGEWFDPGIAVQNGYIDPEREVKVIYNICPPCKILLPGQVETRTESKH